MCGIVGFTGAQSAAPLLLDGLKKLEYRGYRHCCHGRTEDYSEQGDGAHREFVRENPGRGRRARVDRDRSHPLGYPRGAYGRKRTPPSEQ